MVVAPVPRSHPGDVRPVPHVSRTVLRWRAWPAGVLGAAFAGLAAVAVGLGAAAQAGPVTLHMAVHLVLMNLLAPLLALAIVRRRGLGGAAGGWALAVATAAQCAVLWAAHAPPALALAMHAAAFHAAVQAGLLGVALWFWLAVLAQRGAQRWRAILALLATGKLFCLLGALLVLAPRPLYDHHPGAAHGGLPALDDQQLAGLLMLAACALTYVVAGAMIAARWLRELAQAADAGQARPA